MIQYISQDLFIRTNKSVKKNVIKLFKSGPAFSEERKFGINIVKMKKFLND